MLSYKSFGFEWVDVTMHVFHTFSTHYRSKLINFSFHQHLGAYAQNDLDRILLRPLSQSHSEAIGNVGNIFLIRENIANQAYWNYISLTTIFCTRDEYSHWFGRGLIGHKFFWFRFQRWQLLPNETGNGPYFHFNGYLF